MRRYLLEMVALYDAFEEVNTDENILFSEYPSEADDPRNWEDEVTAFLVGVETGGPLGVEHNVVCADCGKNFITMLLYRGVDTLPEATKDGDYEIRTPVTSDDGKAELKAAMRELLANLID